MKYSANYGVGFSAPLVCKQTKCLSTTTVCGIQNDVKYHGVGNVANEANIGSGTGCKAFCRGAHQDAKYFTYSPNKSCWCFASLPAIASETGAESGAIHCDGSGKFIP